MPGRRGIIVFACLAALAVPAGALAQEQSTSGSTGATSNSATGSTAQSATGSTAQSATGSTSAPAATTQAPPGATTQASPGATTQAPPAATTQPPAATTQPAPAATTQPASTGSGRSVPIALIALGAVLLAALALWGFARWWAWEPPWVVRWRHATGEAGWRASAAWAEFTDWLRLGR